jgi:hypothetical protein
MTGQPKKYELLVRLKELDAKYAKALAALDSIAFAKAHIWNRQDLSDKAMNALVALGEYERVTAPPNVELSGSRPKQPTT